VTAADLERRIRQLEQDIVDLKRSQAVLATGIALARWLAPFTVSVVAIVLIIAKGG
jgi:hypothetical protein